MKTATITWITYNNYGTELQAYALQKYLNKNGIDNDIISDLHIVNKSKKGVTTSKEVPTAVQAEKWSVRIKRLARKYLFHPIRLGKVIYDVWEDKRRDKAASWYRNSQLRYDEFKKAHLSIVYGLYREDMLELNRTYDAFLCGSDQIWSVLDVNFDGYFYLDFAAKKKIAYATSIGTDKISPEKSEQIAVWLKDYHAISVRESATAKQLAQISGQPVHWVCDPTLLHDRSFWEMLCKDIVAPKKKYMVCYFLSNKSWYFTYAVALAKHLGLTILLIPSCAEYTQRRECCRQGVGPKEFVALFRDARFVLTDSYHGSIFSLLFEKNFLYLKRFSDADPNSQNIRIISLFEKLGLQKHIIMEKEFTPNDIQYTDYIKIEEILSDFRKKSGEFLLNALR